VYKLQIAADKKQMETALNRHQRLAFVVGLLHFVPKARGSLFVGGLSV
jgi:hypothetical protein